MYLCVCVCMYVCVGASLWYVCVCVLQALVSTLMYVRVCSCMYVF
jgi:hypothetical protein